MARGQKEPIEGRLEALQARLEGLVRELEGVRGRLATLEARWRGTNVPEPSPAEPHQAAASPIISDASDADTTDFIIPAGTITLIGRTLMVLAGAYLLRYMTPVTDTAVVEALGGVTIGLAYGIAWLFQADRAASAEQRLSATFHGLAAAMITCPLIWETTVVFGLLPTTAAATALVLLLALGLSVAWRHDLPEVGWITTLFMLATAMSLLLASHDLMPFTIALLLIAAAVEALAFRDRWLGLRWPVALGLDVAVLLMVFVASRPEGIPETYTALSPVGVALVGLALAGLYVGSIAARSLVRERPVTPFEVFQAGAALLLGFGGAVRVIAFNGGDPTVIGLLGLLLGAACYGAAFTVVDRRLGRARNFYCYTTFAGLLTLAGTSLVLGATALAIAWAALAVLTLLLGGWLDRITLRFHGAVYLTAAAVVAGLVACAADGLLGDSTGTWRPLTPICLPMAVTAAGCYGILLATGRKTVREWVDLLPQAIVAAAVVWSIAGMAAKALAATFAAAPGPAADAAVVATSRTAVLAVTAVVLAWTGRRWSLQELTWLVYPVLVGAGIRLLLEDLSYGRPETLFVTLALYGGALIATPWLMYSEQ